MTGSPDPSPPFKRIWSKLGSRVWYALALFLSGVVGVLVVQRVGQTPSSTKASPDYYGWAGALLVASIVLLVVGLLALVEWDNRRRYARGDRRARVERLTRSLREALQAIEAVTAEIEEGQRVLQQLESDLAARRHAAQLSQDETTAIERIVRREFKHESRRAWVRDLAFLILGAILGAVADNLWAIWF